MAGNEHTFYTFGDDPFIDLPQEIALNRAALRTPVTATSSADALSPAELPVIHGDPGIPVLSVHGIGDLFVPLSMDQQYDAMMVAHGEGATCSWTGPSARSRTAATQPASCRPRSPPSGRGSTPENGQPA